LQVNPTLNLRKIDPSSAIEQVQVISS
jgi:hypothetical protein